MRYEELWSFRSGDFRVTLECAPEPYPDSSWWDEETRDKIERDVWGVYVFKVAVYWRGQKLAADHLGDSVYADPREFRDHREAAKQTRELRAKGNPAIVGSYFSDMVHQAISEARREWNRPRPRLRAA